MDFIPIIITITMCAGLGTFIWWLSIKKEEDLKTELNHAANDGTELEAKEAIESLEAKIGQLKNDDDIAEYSTYTDWLVLCHLRIAYLHQDNSATALKAIDKAMSVNDEALRLLTLEKNPLKHWAAVDLRGTIYLAKANFENAESNILECKRLKMEALQKTDALQNPAEHTSMYTELAFVNKILLSVKEDRSLPDESIVLITKAIDLLGPGIMKEQWRYRLQLVENYEMLYLLSRDPEDLNKGIKTLDEILQFDWLYRLVPEMYGLIWGFKGEDYLSLSDVVDRKENLENAIQSLRKALSVKELREDKDEAPGFEELLAKAERLLRQTDETPK